MSKTARRARARDLLTTFAEDGMLLVRSTSRGSAVLVDPYAIALLSACGTPRTRAEVVRELGEPAGDLFDQLEAAELLLPPDRTDETPVLFGNYAGIEVHRHMLGDLPRVEAYQRALSSVIRPGDVVIDAGAGTGILTVLAAKAGAAKVYAIERTDFARVVRQVAKDSGVGDRVEVIQDDFRNVRLPERARVLVSETVGAWVLAEGAPPDLRACVDHNLLPDGVVIPGTFSLHLAPMPVAPPDLLAPFRAMPNGVNLSCLREEAKGQASNRLIPAASIGAPVTLGTFSMLCDIDGEGLSAEVEIDGPAEALCAWFTLHLAPGVDLPSAPFDPPTHWRQTALPVGLPAGRHTLHFDLSLAPEDRRTLLVDISGAVEQSIRVH